MQPWRISAGLTAALAGSAVLAGGSRLEYLAPFWRLILADYGLAIAAHLGLVLAAALLQKSDSIPNALPPDRLGDGQKRLHLPI